MAVRVQRLLRRSQFLKVKTEGLRHVTQSFVLQVLPAPAAKNGTPLPLGVEAGFTTSGALGNAVHRNRARRRLKAAFDDALRLNPHARVEAPLWLVIVGKMPIFEIGYRYLVADMKKALAAAGVKWDA